MLTNQVKDNLRRKTFGESVISLPQMKGDKQNIVLPLAAGESTTADHLANNSEVGFRNQIILCGIESHVCVLQVSKENLWINTTWDVSASFSCYNRFY